MGFLPQFCAMAPRTEPSFGLLALSRTPALQAFGLTMLIGTTTVWFLAPCITAGEEKRI